MKNPRQRERERLQAQADRAMIRLWNPLTSSAMARGRATRLARESLRKALCDYAFPCYAGSL